MSICTQQVALSVVASKLHRYAPYLITTIANRWTATTSRHYFREFSVGVTEYRVLSALAEFGQATSLEIANLISMDAAAVSRAVRGLSESGSVASVAGKYRGRNKPIELTTIGQDLYKRIREQALQREDILLRNLSEDERTTLLALLSKVHSGLADLT